MTVTLLSSYKFYPRFTMMLIILLYIPCVLSKHTHLTPIEDPMKKNILKESDIFRFTSQPSYYPTRIASMEPSHSPSLSYFPSIAPSNQPSESLMPSSQYDEGFIPNITDTLAESFFNYNPEDTNFGPGQVVEKLHELSRKDPITNATIFNNITYLDYEGNNWINNRNSDNYFYWESLKTNRTLDNRCYSDPSRQQSPIDLCDEFVNTQCFEHHQIRNVGGDYDLDDENVQLKILPSKLRIEYSQFNTELKDEFKKPPHSDFAHNWNGYIPVIHIDIKIPSEHTICGKRYEGEYQIFYYHAKRREPIVQSILIDTHAKERPHLHFQRLLDIFQAIADERRAFCFNEGDRNETATGNAGIPSSKPSSVSTTIQVPVLKHDEEKSISKTSTRLLQEVAEPCFDSNQTFVIEMDNYTCSTVNTTNCDLPTVLEYCPFKCSKCSKKNEVNEEDSDDVTTTKRRWSPFFPRIINSIYFYAYQGSLTEPPCSEWVSWRVLDKPLEISTQQLMQMKDILFNQLDHQCRRSSVHWNGSVARPIQSLNERPLWHCTEDNYLSDQEKRQNS